MLGQELVDRVVADYRSAGLAAPLEATLAFIEKLSLTPEQLGVGDIHALRALGLTDADIDAAAQVAALFHTINRVADALGFQLQGERGLSRSATALIRRGYRI